MVGPLKGGSLKKKYLSVTVDKFTTWIEAKPVKTAEAGPVIDFISGIVHRYGVPPSFISANGSSFTADDSKHGVLIWALSLITPPSITRKQMFK